MGTHFKGTDEETRALDAYIKLVRAGNSVVSQVGSVVAREKLTWSQFGILEALYHLGPLNQKELAAKILKSGPNITMVIDNLERDGLVRRERNPQDRRAFIVSPTEKGTALIARIFPEHKNLIVEVMQRLEPDELAELSRLCRKLGAGK